MACVGATSVLEVVSKGITRCGVKILGSEATLHSGERWIKALTVGDVITLHNPTMRMLEQELHIYVDQAAGSHIFIQGGAHRGPLQSAEIFAGLAGWGRACETFNEEVAMFVEKDGVTAQACAQQHKCRVLSPEAYIDLALQNKAPEQVVIQGDVSDPCVWAAMCLRNVAKVYASPPCQPWCSRGSSTGLQSPDGQLFPLVGKWCGKTRMMVLLMENVSKCPSMSDADVMHVNMTKDERDRLIIPQDAMEMLADSQLAPEWIKAAAASLEPDHILQARVLDSGCNVAGIMARYGSQHKLPISLLQEKGLLTPLTKDHQGVRYFSPWEFLSALGYHANTVISHDLEEAWQMSGNGISVAHSWLQIYKTHMMMGALSPFHPQKAPCEQIKQFQKDAIKLSQYVAYQDGPFWKLEHVDTEPMFKKARKQVEISPTIPMLCEEIDYVTTQEFHKMPDFLWMNDKRVTAVSGGQYGDLVVQLMHDQKHWIMNVNVNGPMRLSDVVLKGLPHADEQQFAAFWHEGNSIQWDQEVICRTDDVITFATQMFRHLCTEDSLQQTIVAFVDTTWTANTMLAYCAVKLGCNPDVLTLNTGPTLIQDQDYLMAYEVEEWTLKFRSKTPKYVEWSPVITSIADEGIFPIEEGQCRWVARHPTKKVIRTVVAEHDVSLRTLVQRLFPDLHANTPWKVHHCTHELDNNFAANIWDDLELQWEGFRPFQVTGLTKLKHAQSIAAPGIQQFLGDDAVTLHVRSPFHVKSSQMKVEPDMTVKEFAAHFLTSTQIATSMICFNGSAVVDPNLKASECDVQGTYSFRLYPLLGGVKHEAVRNRVKVALASRGVPEDKVLDRLNGFASKANSWMKPIRVM
eukprot:Skav208234  [mRNA]  locus=scaffold2601:170648:175295:+ [translate_table: standard]